MAAVMDELFRKSSTAVLYSYKLSFVATHIECAILCNKDKTTPCEGFTIIAEHEGFSCNIGVLSGSIMGSSAGAAKDWVDGTQVFVKHVLGTAKYYIDPDLPKILDLDYII